MNERIKELARQAEFSEKDLHIQADNFQMFAELIVQECMKAADEGMSQVTMKVEWPSYHIKKHFELSKGVG